VSSFALAGVLSVTFIWWQLRAKDPMLDLKFFRNKIFSMGVSARFLNFLASSSVFFLMPFYLINGLGYSPSRAGLLLVPGALCMAIMGPISGRLSDKVGSRWTTSTGLALSTAAMFTFSRLTIDSSPGHVIAGLVLFGLGIGTFNAANTSVVLRSQGQESFGIVAALINVIRTAGNVTGIAVATTIVTVTMGSLGYEPSLAAVADAGGEGVKAAFLSGLNRAFLAAGSMTLLAMAVSVMHGTKRSKPRPAEALATRTKPGPSTKV
jgi:MFS family permease